MQLHSIETIIRALHQEKVEFLIVGGLAVNAHGYQRSTADVDLVVGLEPENVLRGFRALRNAGYQFSLPITPEQFADPEQRQRWMHEKNMVVLKLWSEQHRSTPIDIFVYEPFDFRREYESAVWLELEPGLRIPFIRLETLMIMKQATGRTQDQADVEALAEIQRMRQSNSHELR
jgi:hypothetical protein